MPDETIAWYQILGAALLTGAAVGFAARRSNWPLAVMVTAAVGTALLIGLWRWLANLWQLNADFVPLISAADAGCLVAGAISPAIVALTAPSKTTNRWLPVVLGGVVGFVVNVVVL
ncbi:MAG TPA: hypothetical protein VIR57_08795 [Chloroflexota bacterium]|jgi:hypothetical protein